METSLSDKTWCVTTSNGIEVWISESEKTTFLAKYQMSEKGNLIEVGGQFVNASHITGVFKAGIMYDAVKRKNGGWKCEHGNWHDKGQKCQCLSKQAKARKESIENAIANCDICKEGWIAGENGMRRCDCVKPFYKEENI